MTSTLNTTGIREAYADAFGLDNAASFTLEGEDVPAGRSKELYLSMMHCASSDNVQKNLSRVVLRNVSRNADAARPLSFKWFFSFQPARLEVARQRQQDHDAYDALAEFITDEQSIADLCGRLEQEFPADIVKRVVVALVESFPHKADCKSHRDHSCAPQQSFILHAQRLAERGHTDAALDYIYDQADQMMRTSRFKDLNAAITNLPIGDLTLDVLLGILTSTAPAARELSARPELFTKIQSVLKARGEYEPGLLHGLEG